MILDDIHSPEDLRALDREKFPALAQEIRYEILRTIMQNGGHLASSLGVVELTLALHYCFDLSKDHLIFDVGHQCYPHKILTGRRDLFNTIRKLGGLSGFPYPPESAFDRFHTGHAGTSISLAAGKACWPPSKDEKKRVIAVIGDASLGAGVALEALNWAGQRDCNMLIVLNDNEMSISKTVGSLARYLNRIRMGSTYRGMKKELQNMVSKFPIIGGKMDKGIGDLIKTLKTTLIPGQLFEEFGCSYYGPIDGHDMPLLIDTIQNLDNFEGLRLLHILTEKGKGFEYAVEDPETFHGVSPGTGRMDGRNGKVRIKLEKSTFSSEESYTSVFGRKLVDLAAEDERVVAITAAMPDGTGLKKFSERFPDRYFDVGITEQHAVAFASGMAHGGAKPVVAVYSTFLQRCYDQIFQEICLQNSDVVLAMDRGGIVGQDGPTHHGLYDIAYLRTLPKITLMSPKNGREFEAMIKYAIEHKGPVGLRYPRALAAYEKLPSAPIEYGKGELLLDGEDVLIVAYGPMVMLCLEAIKFLEKKGVRPALINARFAKPLDMELIQRWMVGKKLLVTVEEHALAGGFGSAVAEQLAEIPFQAKLVRLGVEDRFIQQGTRKELLEILGLNPRGIADRILECVNEQSQKPSHTRGRSSLKDQEVF